MKEKTNMKEELNNMRETIRNEVIALDKDIAKDFSPWGKLNPKTKIAISMVILLIFATYSIRFFNIYIVNTGFAKIIVAVTILTLIALTVFCEIDKRGWLMTSVEIVAIVVLLRVLAGMAGVDTAMFDECVKDTFEIVIKNLKEIFEILKTTA